MTWIEIVGYLASMIIAVSLMMKSMVRLRWLNLCGASTFAIYGFIIDAYPVFILNGFITIVDIVYILQMYYKKDYFEVFHIKSLQTPFAKRFLEFYEEDIKYFFPDAGYDKIDNPHVFFIVRNMLPVGLFIGESRGNGALEIIIEYAVPDYRDLKNAFYLYEKKNEHFLQYGYTKLQIKTMVPEHIKYVKKMGFNRDSKKGSGWYTLELE